MDPALTNKRSALREVLEGLNAAVVAYSGGVDSTLLASAAHEALGPRSVAITAASPSMSKRELTAASRLAAERGWNHIVVDAHEIDREEYARNRADRCYWCKIELLDVLEPVARTSGAAILLGTNVDDLADYRPGQKAASERAARAPFVEVGLTKAEIRALSAAEGLSTADKPATPCLASRIAYGVRVTPERLRRVDRAEELLLARGFSVLRVRDHGDLARIEVPVEEVERVATLRAEIVQEFFELGFRYVTVDLKGFRSGSMNEVLNPPRLRSRVKPGGDHRGRSGPG